MLVRAIPFAMVLLSAAASAQFNAPVLANSADTSRPEYMEGLRSAVVSIGQSRVDAGKTVFSTNGSGVLISDGVKTCLLTAKHMLFLPEEGWTPTEVTIHVPPRSGRAPSDGIVVKLVDGQRNLWTSTSDGSDLAVLPLDKAKFSAAGAAMLPTSALGDDGDVYQDESIFVMGYPALLGEDYLSTPWARNGIIAWDNPVDADHKAFLVDANLYPGNSGGPVFRAATGSLRDGGYAIGMSRPKLIGIVSKGAIEHAAVEAGGVPITVTNNATGKVSEADARVLGIGGVGIIEPVARARGIIDSCLKAAS